MTEGVRIVSLAPRRVPELHALLGEIARERRWLAMVDAPPLEDVTHFVLASLAAGGVHLAALDRSGLIGWCDVRRADRLGAQHVGRLGMGVSVAHRGRGLGGLLLREAIARAPQRGIERIELEVFASNAAAIELYRRCGFLDEGLARDAWRLDDWRDDIVRMARRVGDQRT